MRQKILIGACTRWRALLHIISSVNFLTLFSELLSRLRILREVGLDHDIGLCFLQASPTLIALVWRKEERQVRYCFLISDVVKFPKQAAPLVLLDRWHRFVTMQFVYVSPALLVLPAPMTVAVLSMGIQAFCGQFVLQYKGWSVGFSALWPFWRELIESWFH